MREIKFRAWIEPENRMERGLFGLRSDGEPSMQGNADGFTVTLMQFTGLRDKNGREIYEGDVVLVPAGYGGDYWCSEYIGVVEYDAPGFYVEPQDHSQYTQDFAWTDVEVIGSCYENPELCPT